MRFLLMYHNKQTGEVRQAYVTLAVLQQFKDMTVEEFFSLQ